MEIARILLVEDDATIGDGLRRALQAQGYAVAWAETGAEALRLAAGDPFDLVLLDLRLPDLDGVEVCRHMRSSQPALTIVMLTARSDEIDVVVGLDAGADDYLTKPFRLAELLARVRAHVRRLDPAGKRRLVGDLELDPGARRAWLGGNELALRPKEFDLLALLMSESGKVVTRERIMTEVWDAHWFGSTKTLDMHIAALRRRLGEVDGRASRITTLRGVGYRLEREPT
jgi:DNA-binding response OmpR family regulator